MTDSPTAMAATLRENIAELTARQREQAHGAPLTDRVADRITRFTGSITFVVLHLVVFGLWILSNLGIVPGVPKFDPSFVVLAMVASVEAIFLSTFVLISQNRMATAADRRADLDLHVNLLAEHELSRLAGLVARIAAKLDVPVDEAEFAEISADIDPTQVLDALQKRQHEAGLEH